MEKADETTDASGMLIKIVMIELMKKIPSLVSVGRRGTN
jgi:hypothetical protein